MKRLLILIILMIIPAKAQIADTVNFVVDSIKIKGNDQTKEFVILREITFKEGDTLNFKKVKYNQERIFSLGLFSKVAIYAENKENKSNAIIEVEEVWYIYPIPFVDIKDGDWKKFSYGMDLMIKNVRGRNETLGAKVSLGYDPYYSAYYSIPSLTEDGNYYFYGDVSYSTFRNYSLKAKEIAGGDFDYKYIYFNLGVGRRFGLYQKLYLSGGFNYYETEIAFPLINASNSRIDKLLNLIMTYTYDTRDLAQFPHNGIFASGAIRWMGLGINQYNYAVMALDFKEYRTFFGDLISKWRTTLRTTIGSNIPYFDNSFLGLGDRVRGHYREVREGKTSMINTLELNYPIIKDLHLNFDFLPIIPDKLLRYRIGFYVQAFADAGLTFWEKEKVSLRKFYSGYGGGVTFLFLPYNIMRIEAAFDEYKNLEWIVDLGISF